MVNADKKLSVEQYLNQVPNPGRREDARVLVKLMQEASGEEPVNHGICIGFGNYHYRYDSGVEGDSPLVAFKPQKAKMVIYIMPGFSKYGDLLSKLGNHSTGKSCLYLGRLNKIDLNVLGELIRKSVEEMRSKYNC